MRTFFKILPAIIVFSSCNSKDTAKFTVSDFKEIKTITLEPGWLKPYAMLKMHVKGYCNDSVRINYNLYGDSNFYLAGEVDTLLIQTDYYGEGPVDFVFDPYKATEGELEIDINL